MCAALALAAGLSLGMVCLGSGGAVKPLSDLRLEEKLSLYIVGGRHETVSAEANIDCQNDVDTEPQLVKESDSINIEVTAPGAILALALMYLRTNDSSALKWYSRKIPTRRKRAHERESAGRKDPFLWASTEDSPYAVVPLVPLCCLYMTLPCF